MQRFRDVYKTSPQGLRLIDTNPTCICIFFWFRSVHGFCGNTTTGLNEVVLRVGCFPDERPLTTGVRLAVIKSALCRYQFNGELLGRGMKNKNMKINDQKLKASGLKKSLEINKTIPYNSVQFDRELSSLMADHQNLTTPVSARIPSALYSAVRMICSKDKLTVSGFVALALNKYVRAWAELRNSGGVKEFDNMDLSGADEKHVIVMDTLRQIEASN